MSRYQTAEEVRAELVERLGPELGSQLYVLQNDLHWLHLKWRQYRELFGTKPERIKLLNEAAPLFFKVVDDVFWEDTLLHITRFVDAAEWRGKPRLSLRRLPLALADPILRAEVEALVKVAVEKTAFARDWRNRRIAHRDLAHALDPHVEPLAPASRRAVEEALEALRNVLNHINGRLRDTEGMFTYNDPIGGAEALLYVIRDGNAAAREYEAALREGRLSPSEWGPRVSSRAHR